MPQIKVYLNEAGRKIVKPDTFNDLGICLIHAVETAFCIEGKNDVAFDIFEVAYTKNESPVQIEVLYTVGTDDYGRGELFDPPEEVRRSVTEKILWEFSDFRRLHSIAETTPSVWIRPQHNSTFTPGSQT